MWADREDRGTIGQIEEEYLMCGMKPLALPAQTKFLITDIKENYFKLYLFFRSRPAMKSYSYTFKS
jgi:hypothetical protein